MNYYTGTCRGGCGQSDPCGGTCVTIQGLWARKALAENRGRGESGGPWAPGALRGSRAVRDRPVPGVLQVLWVHEAPRVSAATRDPRVISERSGFRVCGETPAHRAP